MKKTIVILVVVVFTALMLASCSAETASAPPMANAPAPSSIPEYADGASNLQDTERYPSAQDSATGTGFIPITVGTTFPDSNNNSQDIFE